MKKLPVLFLLLLAVLSLAACAAGGEPVKTAYPTAEDRVSAENPLPESSANSSESGGAAAQINETEKPETGVLVAYFSATNTTAGVARQIADLLGADLYEIIPEEPYTDTDLNYNDNNSRTTLEMNDLAARPAISGSVENMEQYGTVFIGYPIWWADAPRIISTFVESYDFSGKTIVPFCTSGGSGIGSSADHLEALASGARWLPGQRFSGGSSRSEIAEWLEQLDWELS